MVFGKTSIVKVLEHQTKEQLLGLGFKAFEASSLAHAILQLSAQYIGSRKEDVRTLLSYGLSNYKVLLIFFPNSRI